MANRTTRGGSRPMYNEIELSRHRSSGTGTPAWFRQTKTRAAAQTTVPQHPLAQIKHGAKRKVDLSKQARQKAAAMAEQSATGKGKENTVQRRGSQGKAPSRSNTKADTQAAKHHLTPSREQRMDKETAKDSGDTVLANAVPSKGRKRPASSTVAALDQHTSKRAKNMADQHTVKPVAGLFELRQTKSATAVLCPVSTVQTRQTRSTSTGKSTAKQKSVAAQRTSSIRSAKQAAAHPTAHASGSTDVHKQPATGAAVPDLQPPTENANLATGPTRGGAVTRRQSSSHTRGRARKSSQDTTISPDAVSSHPVAAADGLVATREKSGGNSATPVVQAQHPSSAAAARSGLPQLPPAGSEQQQASDRIDLPVWTQAQLQQYMDDLPGSSVPIAQHITLLNHHRELLTKYEMLKLSKINNIASQLDQPSAVDMVIRDAQQLADHWKQEAERQALLAQQTGIEDLQAERDSAVEDNVRLQQSVVACEAANAQLQTRLADLEERLLHYRHRVMANAEVQTQVAEHADVCQQCPSPTPQRPRPMRQELMPEGLEGEIYTDACKGVMVPVSSPAAHTGATAVHNANVVKYTPVLRQQHSSHGTANSLQNSPAETPSGLHGFPGYPSSSRRPSRLRVMTTRSATGARRQHSILKQVGSGEAVHPAALAVTPLSGVPELSAGSEPLENRQLCFTSHDGNSPTPDAVPGDQHVTAQLTVPVAHPAQQTGNHENVKQSPPAAQVVGMIPGALNPSAPASQQVPSAYTCDMSMAEATAPTPDPQPFTPGRNAAIRLLGGMEGAKIKGGVRFQHNRSGYVYDLVHFSDEQSRPHTPTPLNTPARTAVVTTTKEIMYRPVKLGKLNDLLDLPECLRQEIVFSVDMRESFMMMVMEQVQKV